MKGWWKVGEQRVSLALQDETTAPLSSEFTLCGERAARLRGPERLPFSSSLFILFYYDCQQGCGLCVYVSVCLPLRGV